LFNITTGYHNLTVNDTSLCQGHQGTDTGSNASYLRSYKKGCDQWVIFPRCVFSFSLHFILLKTIHSQQSQTVTIHTELDSKATKHRHVVLSFLQWQSLQMTCHKPSGRLPLLSARPAVTLATLKKAATNFAAWWTEAWRVWTVCLRLIPDSIAAATWTQALLCLSPAR